MNDEIRTILVRSREDIGWQRFRDRMSVSRVVECQGDSSESSIKGSGIERRYLRVHHQVPLLTVNS